MQRKPARFPPHVRHGDLVHREMRGAAVEDVPAFLAHHCRFKVAQLAHGVSCCDFDLVAGSQAALCRQRIARPLHLHGIMTGGWIGLGLVHDETPDDGTSKAAHDDLLHLVLPEVPFDWYLRAGRSLLLVMAGYDALLESAGAPHAETGVRLAIGMGDRISRLRLESAVATEAREALTDLLEDARRGELEHSGEAFGRVALEAMILLLDAAEDAGATRGSAEALVSRARGIVDENQRRFSIADLSGELRVSPRTLHKAFVDITGVAPHAFFLRQRLNAARHQLATGDPFRHTVRSIALKFGFTELGRFASRYRNFFGENPSQTLQRPARPIELLPG